MKTRIIPEIGRPNLDAGANVGRAAWLIAEKMALLLSGLFVGLWVVRTLGPEQFGRFSAALSVTSIFAGLSVMGLETVTLRRFAARTSNASALMAASASLRLIGSVAYAIICWLVARTFFAQDPGVATVALIVASGSIFRIPDVVGLWMQAEDRYRSAAIVRISVRATGDVARLALIWVGASMYWFAGAFVLESIVAGIVFSAVGRKAMTRPLIVDRVLCASLFREGRPIVVTAMLSALYARVDQLLLYKVMGADATGNYAAAVRISEVFNLVITSVAAVAASHFGRMHELPDSAFNAAMLAYYRLMLALGFVISLSLSLLAGPIVRLMYGDSFGEAVPLLRIHAWTVVLVFASVAIEPWFYHYGKVIHFVSKTILALAFSGPAVLLGVYWYGAEGAAMAVVATYAVSAFLTNALIPGARGAFRFQLRGLIGLKWAS